MVAAKAQRFLKNQSPFAESDGRICSRPSISQFRFRAPFQSPAAPRTRGFGMRHAQMMFTDEFRASLLERFANRSEWERPEIWLVATSDNRHLQRAWLNRTIDSLSEPGRSKVVARLPENAHFLSTYTELATAAILQDAGLAIEYEPDLGGKTPDLVVFGDAGPLMLVEVYTKFRHNELRRDEKAWRALQARVQRIPVPVMLAVNRKDGPAPDDATAKRIATRLKEWLLQVPGVAKMNRILEGYDFMIEGQSPGLYATMTIPGGGGWFNSDLVLNAVNEKVSSYAPLADQLDVPLLVVLAAEPASPLSEDLVGAALAGTMATALKMDYFTMQSEPHTVNMRFDQTPATFAGGLSAVGWVAPGIDEPGTLTIFPVSSATRPIQLPETMHLRLG